MKTKTVRLIIIIFLLLPPLVSPLIPAGQAHYRVRERIEAMKAYILNPSALTKATLDEEHARLHHHEKMMIFIFLSSILLVDVLVVYLFWNRGTRKTLA